MRLILCVLSLLISLPLYSMVHQYIPNASSWSPATIVATGQGNGINLAVGFNDGSLQLYNQQTLPTVRTVLQDEASPLVGLDFLDGDEKIMATNKKTGSIIWDVVRSTIIQRVVYDKKRICCSTYLPDQQLVVVGCSDGSLCLFDRREPDVSKKSVQAAEAMINVLAYSAFLHSISAGDASGTLSSFDVRRFDQSNFRQQCNSSIQALSYDKTGALVAAGDETGCITLWDVARKMTVHKLGSSWLSRIGIKSMVAAPKGSLFVAWRNQELILWDYEHELVKGIGQSCEQPSNLSSQLLAFSQNEPMLFGVYDGIHSWYVPQSFEKLMKD
jgi:WD40 repeat protein